MLAFYHGAGDPNADDSGLGIQSEFINLLLQSVGVTVTEFTDVVLKYVKRRELLIVINYFARFAGWPTESHRILPYLSTDV